MKRIFPNARPITPEIIEASLCYIEFPITMNHTGQIIGISYMVMEPVVYLDRRVRNKPLSDYKRKAKNGSGDAWSFDRETFSGMLETYMRAKNGEVPYLFYEEALAEYKATQAQRAKEKTESAQKKAEINEQKILALHDHSTPNG